MSPQRSNRDRILEGALRCLERLPPEQVTARAIAEESGANLASITYHFGSKDTLVTMAVIQGLDRWLEEVARSLDDLSSLDVSTRFLRAAEAMVATRRQHAGLARMFVTAVNKAQHDASVRDLLTAGFTRSRGEVAAVLGLGDDQAGNDAGGLVLAMFNGLLLQALLHPDLVIENERLEQALGRLGAALPGR